MNSCAVTDIGQYRQSNQDFVYASDQPLGKLQNFYLVADGMGGHRGGGFASRYAAERMTELMAASTEEEIVQSLNHALAVVNREIYQKAGSFEELSGMGTTTVAATIWDDVLYVMNVGDSRLYMIGETIRQVTRDHSWVEDMVSQGRMARGSELYYRRKNVITRAVGVSETVTADFFEIDIHPGDKILLCSDGLCNMVPDEVIRETVSGHTCQEAALQLIQTANAQGAPDNISVIIIDPEMKEEETC